MPNAKILCLVGGISHDSLNKKLFHAFKENAPEGFEIEEFKIESLPFFSQDLEKSVPPIVKEFRQLVADSDAILFITPEYNRSLPGVLKNAIDWASRPYGQSVWNDKTAAVCGASIGNIGTFGAQHHLRQILAYLNVRTMGQPEFYLNASKSFDKNGVLLEESHRSLITKFWSAFEKWIEANKKSEVKSSGFEPRSKKPGQISPTVQ